jgi:hypothetical protein
LMMGEHKHKGGGNPHPSGYSLGWVRPRTLLLWALVDLDLVRRRLVGIAGWAESRCVLRQVVSKLLNVRKT